jgi:hypothetical protein
MVVTKSGRGRKVVSYDWSPDGGVHQLRSFDHAPFGWDFERSEPSDELDSSRRILRGSANCGRPGPPKVMGCRRDWRSMSRMRDTPSRDCRTNQDAPMDW